MPVPGYIATGEAARSLGVSPVTLTRWAAAGLVTPAERTAGGHYRWDLPVLRAQVLRARLIEEGIDPRVIGIAAVIHDANRRLQLINGEETPSPVWEEAPERQVRSSIAGTQFALGNPDVTPEEMHEHWYADMERRGFRHGPVKDEEALTHPAMVHWPDLPEHQKAKTRLLIAIARALA
jgi:DNA-binding transcriptional MerR regulator